LPNVKARKESTEDQNDKHRNITPHQVIKETSEPGSKGPSYSNEDHQRSKDTPIGMPLKKICCDEGWKSCCHRISHTEKNRIKVCQPRGREEAE
jgi:hypothetical protein